MRVFVTLYCCLFFSSVFAIPTSYSADKLFERYSKAIFKVRIVDVDSGSQSSIGTGFLVGDGSLLATNFHVISSLIEKPEQYRAEIDLSGNIHQLRIVSFDVVHDLAIMEATDTTVLGQSLSLSLDALNKGTPLYSIGNPHDIGMTVVEGTYNGLVEHRFTDSIHFSGSINPGMSGGPAINTQGGVIGINVATSGEQVGFLVPVDKLDSLLTRIETDRGKAHYALIEQQVSAFSEQAVDELLGSPWPIESMGKAQITGKISDALSCWGSSRENKDNGLKTISKGCSNQDNIYINRNFTVGFMEYEYQYFSAESWNSFSFYEYVSQSISGARAGNVAGKEHVNNFVCQNDVVAATEKSFAKKMSYCVRSYKHVNNLYDVFYISSSIDRSNDALMEHFTLSGVTKLSAHRFLDRFMESASWE